MAIRKKSLTGTLRPLEETPLAAVPAGSLRGTGTAPAKPLLPSDNIALSKRTVSRILLAKSLLGR